MSFAASDDLIKRTTKAAKHMRVRRSELLRLALLEYLDKYGLYSLQGRDREQDDWRKPKTERDT